MSAIAFDRTLCPLAGRGSLGFQGRTFKSHFVDQITVTFFLPLNNSLTLRQ